MNKLTYLCLVLFCATTLTHASIFSRNTSESLAFNEIQRVRIDFTMPNGYVRHLLLGFTPDNAATEGVDYGYDALCPDNFPDDLNWMINNQRYVIQGVGEFIETNQYPLGMFITNSGNISIALNTLENFDSEIDVFLFDAFNNTYTLLNEIDFQKNVSTGTYLDRYFIAFRNNTNGNIIDSSTILSIAENESNETSISFLRQSKEIYVQSNDFISKIEMYNLLGQRVLTEENINSRTLKLPTYYTKENYGIVRVYTDQGVTNKKIVLK